MSIEPPAYQVLARKYRPASFADLIGQDTMVRTLKNAFDSDRIAHAFILTGVRGVGKTTTARIIAKGLNCIGKDGKGGATVAPCGSCEPCVAIAQGRHVDVLEMDAASRTGVDNIREIIDSVHYRAASARYKIYIIDEVHMLSSSAFNALLKTLEEPPAHVKFIFATTEIRKIPITVMSRCQRFDLRRIEAEVMAEFLQKIAKAEKAKIEPDALALLIRAGEGSVRDALSLLDQAIAHSNSDIKADKLRTMLGFADRGRTLDLFHFIMQGDAQSALAELAEQSAQGADPMAILSDLAEVTHWISVVKLSPEAAKDPTISPDVRDRGLQAAEALAMRGLARMWQMLLKALKEIKDAPNALMAAEMAIIRLTHIADLPSPDEIIGLLKAQEQVAPEEAGAGEATPKAVSKKTQTPVAKSKPDSVAKSEPVAKAKPESSQSAQPAQTTPQSVPDSVPEPSPEPTASLSQEPQTEPATLVAIQGGTNGNAALDSAPDPNTDPNKAFTDFAQVVALIRAKNDIPLLYEVETHLRLVSYKPGRIEFQPTPTAAKDLSQLLSQRLKLWTGHRWGVSIVGQGGGETIAEQNQARQSTQREQVKTHPLVAAAMEVFAGAEIVKVHPVSEKSFETAQTDNFETPDNFDADDADDIDDETWDAFE